MLTGHWSQSRWEGGPWSLTKRPKSFIRRPFSPVDQGQVGEEPHADAEGAQHAKVEGQVVLKFKWSSLFTFFPLNLYWGQWQYSNP